MIGKKKVIGVCMTKIQDPPRSRRLAALYEAASRADLKLMIFNSPYDFASGVEDEIGAAGIYDLINYDVIDALIILCSGFLDKSVCKKIIEGAMQRAVPVILEDMLYEGCFTIRNSFEEAFAGLMNHVIRDHGIRDTFFVAGQKDNEYSDQRVAVYKKVLAENGLEFAEDMLDYGGFWSGPTNEVMDRLFAREKELPKAIFCANDAMGVTVCKRLQKNGIRVPQDVIVTGFDGSRMGEFSEPRMATCVMDAEGFAEKAVMLIQEIFAGNNVQKVWNNSYRLRAAESCGCDSGQTLEFKKMAEEYHRLMVNALGHEYVTYNEINYLMNSDALDANLFYRVLSLLLDDGAVLALRPSWLSYAIGESHETTDEELVLMNQGKEAEKEKTKFRISDMVPRKDEWAEEKGMYIINAVQIGKMNCGYYECRTDNVIEDSQKINRVLNLINMVVHMAVSDLKQRYHRIAKGADSLIDPLTEIANLHGLTKWYEDYLADPDNCGKAMTVSIYEMPKYRYIYENYGIQAVESAVCFVAEALKLANPKEGYLAHISNEEFVVINVYQDPSEFAAKINSATSVFFSILDKYNQTNEKKYYIEVNAGCAEVPVVENQKLELLIQMATNEMYRNKVLYGTVPAEKKISTTSKERYDLFNALISKNLFQYHFQPIVQADNGEIYAYEALMRTDQRIGFNPLDVLDIAKEYQRLYDVEKATLFNVMERYVKDNDSFRERKVFINCIPGHFLKEDDREKIGDLYSDYIQHFVFEITEQDTITDQELSAIRGMGNEKGNNAVAIDDYGTGHSNIVNLINYAPEIVKLDRFLMKDIHLDPSKQMLVEGTIKFAKMRNIKVLAEGIETEEELRKVIELGVDYIQGYYTGRPVYKPLAEVDPSIRKIILEEAGRRC